MKGLGRRFAPDPRDHQYALSVPAAPSTRTSRTWSVRGVLDQGETSMCVGYSSAKWVQAGPVVNALPDPVQLYHDAQLNDEFDDTPPGEGSSVRGAMKALQKRGIVTQYNWAMSADAVQHHLLETGPMVFGTNWYETMFEPDAGGNLTINGKVAGGHAWLAIGINTLHRNPDGSAGAIRILNSWGVRWSQKGRAWLSMAGVARLLSEDGEAAIATEIKKAA